MSSMGPARRDYITLLAIEPKDGTLTCEVQMMTAMSNSEFAKRMMLLARPAEQFEPTAIYDPDGDCIEFLAKPDSFYAERVDDLVTVYYSQETNEVIGSLIKGVSAASARRSSRRCPDLRSRSGTDGSGSSTSFGPGFGPRRRSRET